MAKSAKHASIAVLVSMLVCLAAPNSAAQVVGQVATGTPAFGSFGGGPFDTVNLGNLNVHFTVPMINKAGRGTTFNYNMAYDSSVWAPVTSSGVTSWQPAANWGWQGVTEVATGYISYTDTENLDGCQSGPPVGQATGQKGNPDTYFPIWIYTFTSFRDRIGVSHPFSVQTNYSPGCDDTTSASQTSPDGSGYTLYATGNTAYVTTRSGAVVSAPLNAQTGAASFTDPNGNQITVNSSNQFFDTLSSTTPVLTVTGSGTPASPTEFKYTAPSGSTVNYTMNYTQYTVATNFGFSTINEYGPLSNALVSSIGLPDGTSYSVTYEETPGSCTPLSGTYSANCVTGRIASVTLPTGGTITYSYTGGTNSTGIYSDGSTAGVNRTLSPGGEWQYSRSLVSGSPGVGSTWTTTVLDPNGDQTVINFAEDGNTTTPTYNFYETQRTVDQLISGTQTLLLTTTTCYNAHYTSCSAATVSSPITQTDFYRQLPNSSTSLSETVYNSYGLVTDNKRYNYGVATGAAPGTTDLVRETATTYASLSNGIVNRPSTVIVYDWTSGSAVTLSSSSYGYDQTTPTATSGTPQHVAITGSRGNLTTATTSTSSTASLSKTFTYYDTGNPHVATDVNSATTTYVYGTTAQGSSTISCGNSFPTTINEPLSLSRSITWNCTGGVATQVTDENGNNVTASYTDPDFWRRASVTDQMSNLTSISYDGETAVESTLNFNGTTSTSDFLETVDGFGRSVFSQRKQSPTATHYDTWEADYNNLGQRYRTTMPYSTTASPSSDNTTVSATSSTYDALGRVLTTIDAAGGEVAHTYTNNDVLKVVSGTQTFSKQFEYDGLGRLASVCEITSGTTSWPGGSCGQSNPETGYLTKYTYDALGHLLTVTQNAQASGSRQTRTFAYDWLGRMTSETNPETGNSGVSGTVTYAYDHSGTSCGSLNSPGDLVQKNDNIGNATCYVYDALHRLSSSGNTGISGATLRNFIYDSESSYPTGVSVVNGKTHIVETQTTTTTGSLITDEFFSYDKRGEVTDVWESTPHSGGYYHSTASYWANGVLDTLGLFNVSGTALIPAQTYGVDSEGRPNLVSAASGQNPVTSVTYSTSSTTNFLGALTGVTFGSGDSDSFTYNYKTARMSTYSFKVNGVTDKGTLTWNTNRTLSELVTADSIPGTSDSQTCTYSYDDLSRVSAASCGSSWHQTFAYDPFGNIQKSVPMGDTGLAFDPSYIFSSGAITNQFFSIPSVSVAYDGNGNLLTDNLNTYTWDANWGTMLSVNNGSTTVAATYDAVGRMVENNAGGTYTQFVFGPTGAMLAKVNGTTLVKSVIPLPGGAKAIYGPTGLVNYRHSDWLGTSRLTSTAATPTSVYFATAYAPFGEQYATSGTVDASFTGQDQNTVSTLYDFPARRHSPSQGRWISPDPKGRGAVRLTNPQSWNRYAYVINNPLARTDPTGLFGCGDDGVGCMDDGGGGGGDDGGGVGLGGDDGGGCGPGTCGLPPTPTYCPDSGCPWAGNPGDPSASNPGDPGDSNPLCSGPGVPCTVALTGNMLESVLSGNGWVNQWEYVLQDVEENPVSNTNMQENLVQLWGNVDPAVPSDPWTTDDQGLWNDSIGLTVSSVNLGEFDTEQQGLSVQINGTWYPMNTEIIQNTGMINGTLQWGYPTIVVP